MSRRAAGGLPVSFASEFIDNCDAARCERGAIALQLHDQGMRVEFRDIRLRER